MEKIKQPKTLIKPQEQLYVSKEVKENALASEGKNKQKPQKIDMRVTPSQYETIL